MKFNMGDFSDMRMWHYDPDRSSDYPAGRISSDLVKNGVFVFLGNRQPANKIDYEKILIDFDRLLSLYRYVESAGITAPVPLPKSDFAFMPGHSKKVTKAKATFTQKELDLDLVTVSFRRRCISG